MNAARRVWRQLPFFVWLVAVWMLLWGQFTALAAVTGVIVAVVVTLSFRLPPAEMSGRLNPWWALVYVVRFAGALVAGSLTVAWQTVDPRGRPGTAVVAVPLRSNDDLIQTHVGVTASLIPGSLVVRTDRERRVLYLHVIGVRTAADVDRQREGVLRWERLIVRAFGSRDDVRRVEAAVRAGAGVGEPRNNGDPNGGGSAA